MFDEIQMRVWLYLLNCDVLMTSFRTAWATTYKRSNGGPRNATKNFLSLGGSELRCCLWSSLWLAAWLVDLDLDLSADLVWYCSAQCSVKFTFMCEWEGKGSRGRHSLDLISVLLLVNGQDNGVIKENADRDQCECSLISSQINNNTRTELRTEN